MELDVNVKNNNIVKLNLKKFKYLKDDELQTLRDAYKYYYNYEIYFRKVGFKIYHIKYLFLKPLINELLGQIINEYFGASVLKSKIIDKNNVKYGLMTKSFIKEGHSYSNLKSGIFPNFKYDFFNEQAELNALDNLDLIKVEDKYLFETKKEDLKKFKYDLKLMIVSDYIRKQSDRAFRNFMFEYNKNSVKLMPLFDFEFSFKDFSPYLPNAFNFDFNDKNTCNYIMKDDTFQELLYKAMDLDMNIIFEQLMSEYPIDINNHEKEDYIRIVNEQKKNVKKYRLLK